MAGSAARWRRAGKVVEEIDDALVALLSERDKIARAADAIARRLATGHISDREEVSRDSDR